MFWASAKVELSIFEGSEYYHIPAGLERMEAGVLLNLEGCTSNNMSDLSM